VGFFPFEQTRLRIARPVAPGVSDRQGIVHFRGLDPDPVRLLAKCTRQSSPIIDVSHGYEPYARMQRTRSRRTFKSTEYKQRKLRRDLGAVGSSSTRATPTPCASSSRARSRPSTRPAGSWQRTSV
jgi:hypothetical protein